MGNRGHKDFPDLPVQRDRLGRMDPKDARDHKVLKVPLVHKDRLELLVLLVRQASAEVSPSNLILRHQYQRTCSGWTPIMRTRLLALVA